MSDISNGGPAFPVLKLHLNGYMEQVAPGMTLRDYFAAKAMQALIGTRNADYQGEEGPAIVSDDAYLMADAMLKARGGEQ